MKLRKLIYLLILICAVNSVTSLYAKESEKPLTIALIAQNPPFSFRLPNDKPAGLYVEFWQLWSKTNDIPITLILDDFTETIKIVKNKQIDIHSGLFINHCSVGKRNERRYSEVT